MPADLSRISVTAKIAAYYRQFSDIAFAGEVARRIGADDAFEQILREHGLQRDNLIAVRFVPLLSGQAREL